MTTPEPLAWLDALAETHAKATGGVWSNPEWTSTVYGADPAQLLRVASSVHPADAAAIVAAHNAMPELIAALRGVLALAGELDVTFRGSNIPGRIRSTVAAALAGPHTADYCDHALPGTCPECAADEEADRG